MCVSSVEPLGGVFVEIDIYKSVDSRGFIFSIDFGLICTLLNSYEKNAF